jgi:hypothetical protein
MILNDYLNLVTSEHRNKEKFIATLSIDVSVAVRVQELLSSMIPKFDLDLAVGDQLDILGQWVGISREVAIPISGVYFSWNSGDATGWDYGTWRPASAPTQITSLPDDAYLTLIKAKIASNRWDGTTQSAYDIWDSIFTKFKIIIQDNQNMTFDVGITGGLVDSLTLALLTGGYLNLKPEAIRVRVYYAAVDSNPVFAWDSSSTLLAGWNTGSWARILSPT